MMFTEINGDTVFTSVDDGTIVLVSAVANVSLAITDPGPLCLTFKKIDLGSGLVRIHSPYQIDGLDYVTLSTPMDSTTILGDGSRLWTFEETRKYWVHSHRTVTRADSAGNPRDSYTVKREDGGWEIRVDCRAVGQVPAGDIAIYFPPWDQLATGYRGWSTRIRFVNPSPMWKSVYVFPFQGYSLNSRNHTQPTLLTTQWECMEIYTDGQQGFATRVAPA